MKYNLKKLNKKWKNSVKNRIIRKIKLIVRKNLNKRVKDKNHK